MRTARRDGARRGQPEPLGLDEGFREAVDHSSHGVDVIDALLAALVALLAAASATLGNCEEPPAWDSDEGRRASVEGWIAMPTGALAVQAPRRGPFILPA